MTDFEKMFRDSVDTDTSDMYMSLSALHFEAYQKAMDENMKNMIWLAQDVMRRSVMKSINRFIELGLFKTDDIKDLPENFSSKIYFKSTYASYTWFFFMEPEWFWGPKSYSDTLEDFIRKELNWPRCPKCGDYAETHYWESYDSNGDYWGTIWTCNRCFNTKYGIEEIYGIEEDAEELYSKFTIMELEIKEGRYKVRK